MSMNIIVFKLSSETGGGIREACLWILASSQTLECYDNDDQAASSTINVIIANEKLNWFVKISAHKALDRINFNWILSIFLTVILFLQR